jgi:hypothetical protein
MKTQRKQPTPEEKVAILRRHSVEGVPISYLCADRGLQPITSRSDNPQSDLIQHCECYGDLTPA